MNSITNHRLQPKVLTNIHLLKVEKLTQVDKRFFQKTEIRNLLVVQSIAQVHTKVQTQVIKQMKAIPRRTTGGTLSYSVELAKMDK